MNKIDSKLRELQQQKKLGFMTHVVIGYPTLATTKELVLAMQETGVDFIELQIPFSDPLADGPTIMHACEKALANGVRVADAFILVEQLQKDISLPLLFMAYYNTVFHFGVEKFCKEAARVGISGLIVPDMPIDEEGQEHFYAYCKKYGLYALHVVSPASTDERLKKNSRLASGFVYATARQGITGIQKDKGLMIHDKKKDQEYFLKRVRKYFKIPIAVGFGISAREQVESLKNDADIIVVGSAIIDIINKNNSQTMIKAVKDFIKSLKMVK